MKGRGWWRMLEPPLSDEHDERDMSPSIREPGRSSDVVVPDDE